MRYLTFLLSLFLVLSFASCKKEKDASMEMKDTTTEAVEEVVETTDEMTTEAVEEVGEAVEETTE